MNFREKFEKNAFFLFFFKSINFFNSPLWNRVGKFSRRFSTSIRYTLSGRFFPIILIERIFQSFIRHPHLQSYDLEIDRVVRLFVYYFKRGQRCVAVVINKELSIRLY